MKEVSLYTDGACIGNPGPGGYGLVLVYGTHRREISGGYRRTTNNRMELMSVIKGLEALKESCRVSVFSDSKYVVDAFSKGWAEKWRANGWRRNKKEQAINPDLWERVLDLCAGHDVEFRWVKGHSGHPENERCDQLATRAASQPDLPPDEPYEQMQALPLDRAASLRAESPAKGVTQRLALGLRSPDSTRRQQAVFQVGKEGVTDLGSHLANLFDTEQDPIIKGWCAWALGKINHREAESALVDGLNDRAKEVRVWSAWALGEIGTSKMERHLRRAIVREGDDEVSRAIGGALKKLSFEPTRVHVRQLTKQLRPPSTTDKTLLMLVDRLEDLVWPADSEEIVEARAKIQSRDPEFFKMYMKWLERKRQVVETLEDGRRVFYS